MGVLTDIGVGAAPPHKRFCLAYTEAFLVPAEALSVDGIAPGFASLLVEDGRASPEQLECLGSGFALYLQRCADLYARAPRSWFPPRRTNLLVIEDGYQVIPYLEPFKGTSSTLYRSDLDTHPEYICWLLIHMERLSLLRLIPATVAYNLSYWFDRTATSRSVFAAATRRARRPDAAGFVALAEAFGWVDQLVHDPLKVPESELVEPHVKIEGADLYVPRRLQPQLMQLCQAAEDAVRASMTSAVPPTRSRRSTRELDDLCEWLTHAKAHVIVHGPDREELWSPDETDPKRLRRALADSDDATVASMHADLRVVHERSSDFLDRVVDISALPKHCAVLETGGGAYVDPQRLAIVYELQQPAFKSSAGSAPPYHRLLLGARVMHEWGHVAHTARILRVPDENRAGYTAARGELGNTFTALVTAIPEPFRASVVEEMDSISPSRNEWPKALARKTLCRVGDYLANLMCARLIPGEEMQAYVRTNVHHHQDEHLGLIAELARYAYEVNYLDLVGLPRSYFYSTSRFPNYFIETGIVDQEAVEALFDATLRVLECYAIDETRLRLA